jgi:hypothetical protein
VDLVGKKHKCVFMEHDIRCTLIKNKYKPRKDTEYPGKGRCFWVLCRIFGVLLHPQAEIQFRIHHPIQRLLRDRSLFLYLTEEILFLPQ